MVGSVQQTIIKRYANRRLYNSRTGQYVSRKSLEEMARRDEEFVVEDTTTGEDITHSVLGQIIVAQEAVQTEPLLPNEFMRQLLTFYGDTLRTLLSCYFRLFVADHQQRKYARPNGRSGIVRSQARGSTVQQNIRFFEAILLNLGASQTEVKSGEPVMMADDKNRGPKRIRPIGRTFSGQPAFAPPSLLQSSAAVALGDFVFSVNWRSGACLPRARANDRINNEAHGHHPAPRDVIWSGASYTIQVTALRPHDQQQCSRSRQP